MNPQATTIDCRGMRCPAPILKLSKAARDKASSPHLEILADDADFPTDVRAWCQSTGARLEALHQREGFFVAEIALARASVSPAPSSPAVTPPGDRDAPVVDIDCVGMRCPAPILAIAKASKQASGPACLRIRATDGDFKTDVEAWCRSTKNTLFGISMDGGIFEALVGLKGLDQLPLSLGGEAPAPPASLLAPPDPAVPTASSLSTVSIVDIDCVGMRCPAPILAIAKASKQASGPTCLRIRATDGDFKTDVEAWCRSTKNTLFGITVDGGTFEALVGLKGLTELPPSLGGESPAVAPSAAPTASPTATPSSGGVDLDLRNEEASMALLKIGQHSLGTESFSFLVSAGPAFQQQMTAWAAAMNLRVELRQEGGLLRGTLDRGAPVTAPAPVTALAPVTAPVAVDGVPRENRCTMLVLHNDFEPLMAALMVANASAAQGMEVEIYFSFWGVNMLRGARGSSTPGTALERPSLLKRMMKKMMAAGPDRVQLSKMNFGGAGVGMMKHFMKQDNILSLRELMMEAVDLDVKFVVCTMSMGLMGISKDDLMDLPNIRFGGVTAFSGAARVSASSMVF